MSDGGARLEWYIHHRLDRKDRHPGGGRNLGRLQIQLPKQAWRSFAKLSSQGALIGIRHLLVSVSTESMALPFCNEQLLTSLRWCETADFPWEKETSMLVNCLSCVGATQENLVLHLLSLISAECWLGRRRDGKQLYELAMANSSPVISSNIRIN